LSCPAQSCRATSPVERRSETRTKRLLIIYVSRIKVCCLPEELKKPRSTLCHVRVKGSYFFVYATALLVSTLKFPIKVKPRSFVKAPVRLPPP
jgi:hypothetical protein